MEQELLQEAVGAQDQVSAAYGGFNRIDFRPDGTIDVKRILTAQNRLAELEQHLALYFTGFSWIASEIAQEQLKMTPHRKNELDTMLQFIDEAEDIVVNPNRPIHEFGRLLHENWLIKKTLTQKISNANIDEIYEAGLSAGALQDYWAPAAAVLCCSSCRRNVAKRCACVEEAIVRSLQLFK